VTGATEPRIREIRMMIREVSERERDMAGGRCH